MICPIRCFSCGRPIAHLWEEYKKRIDEGEQAKEILDDLKIERFCCRAVFLGHADMIHEVTKFKKA